MTTTAIDRRSGAYLQAAIKLPCRVVATSDIALDGLLTVDGVVLVEGDRVLVTAQSPSTENGIYVADTGEWARSADCNGSRDLVQGTIVAVVSGTVYTGSVWQVTTASPVAGSALAWARMGASALALVSAFMLTVLDDLTAADARTTLGAVGLTGNETVAGVKTFTGANVHSGNNAFSGTNTHSGTESFDALRGTVTPQGRLTLTTAVPMLTGNVAAAATVYYTPYVGDVIPIYDGTGFVLKTFAELSNVLANSATGSAGPAAGAADKNYDLFVWNDAGTLRLTRGGAWNSATARSATAENDLIRVKGLLLNLNAITNGPAASRGTYVGTVRTDAGGATVSWHTGAVAANGTAATLHVWNAYNRREMGGLIGDTTNSWTYTTNTWRSANAQNTMRVSYVLGLQEELVKAEYAANASNASTANVWAGVGLDSTSVPSGRRIQAQVAGSVGLPRGQHADRSLGFHFMQALENSGAVGTTTWYGDNNLTETQTGLTYEGWF